jgi:hypothetical protein
MRRIKYDAYHRKKFIENVGFYKIIYYVNDNSILNLKKD